MRKLRKKRKTTKKMTNPSDLNVPVVLFEDTETREGTIVDSGETGMLVGKLGDGLFLVEIEVVVPRIETAVLSADKFAITESPPASGEEKV